ncbi:MAG: hypothetical protein IJ004_01515 [Clostridia bacterium]|nr:hypothetical protein [Clostridia bacterium]
MYCIKCGVELSKGQTICPICETKVYHPDIEPEEVAPKYPLKPLKTEITSKHGFLAILSACFFITALFLLLADLLILGWESSHQINEWWEWWLAPLNYHIEWSHYLVGAMLVIYASLVVPSWFKKFYSVLCASMVFGSSIIYILFISWITEGWWWFLPFALPTIGFLGLITIASIIICEFLPGYRLVCIGIAFLLVSGFVIALEILINLVFKGSIYVIWSPFVAVVLFAVSVILLCCAFIPSFRASLKKLFFL